MRRNNGTFVGNSKFPASIAFATMAADGERCGLMVVLVVGVVIVVNRGRPIPPRGLPSRDGSECGTGGCSMR